MTAIPKRGATKPQIVKDKARALYMLNHSCDDVAQMIGVQPTTMRQWISRGGWTELRRSNRQKNTLVLDQMAEMAASDVIVAHQKRVETVYNGDLDRLAQLPASTPLEFVQKSQALKNLDDVGRRNLGLSDGSDGNGRSNSFTFNLGALKMPEKVVEIEIVPSAEPASG